MHRAACVIAGLEANLRGSSEFKKCPDLKGFSHERVARQPGPGDDRVVKDHEATCCRKLLRLS